MSNWEKVQSLFEYIKQDDQLKLQLQYMLKKAKNSQYIGDDYDEDIYDKKLSSLFYIVMNSKTTGPIEAIITNGLEKKRNSRSSDCKISCILRGLLNYPDLVEDLQSYLTEKTTNPNRAIAFIAISYWKAEGCIYLIGTMGDLKVIRKRETFTTKLTYQFSKHWSQAPLEDFWKMLDFILRINKCYLVKELFKRKFEDHILQKLNQSTSFEHFYNSNSQIEIKKKHIWVVYSVDGDRQIYPFGGEI